MTDGFVVMDHEDRAGMGAHVSPVIIAAPAVKGAGADSLLVQLRA